MSTTPMQEARTQPPPPSSREEQLSAGIRRSTVRRRLLQATDALAVADLLLGINSSVSGMGKEVES